jgi:hypothetical protein
MRSAFKANGKGVSGGPVLAPNGAMVSTDGGVYAEGATKDGSVLPTGGMAKSGVVNGSRQAALPHDYVIGTAQLFITIFLVFSVQ